MRLIVVTFHVQIDNPISPRGDGNTPSVSKTINLRPMLIDNPISPRGDGNSCALLDRLSNTPIDNPISPRGDGNVITF